MINLLYFMLLLLLGSAAYAGISAAPWVPTRSKERQSVLNRITLTPGQTVYDLGCGDGTMLFALARKFPEARYIGYDISLLPLLIGYARKYANYKKYKNVSLRFGNLFSKTYHDADVVFIFLLEKAYGKLQPLLRNLPNEALVIFEAWRLKDLVPRDIVENEKTLPFYIYEGEQFK